MLRLRRIALTGDSPIARDILRCAVVQIEVSYESTMWGDEGALSSAGRLI